MNKKTFRSLGSASLVIIAVFALYSQFLWNPIVFDDIAFFVTDNGGDQPVSNYHFEWLQLRSLPYATLAWTKTWFGLDLIYFRVGNLFLHATVCIALYGFLSKLFSVTCQKDATLNLNANPTQLSPNVTALIAALIFAVHPVATYAAGYLVQRTILFATLFCLLAMWVWVHCCARRQPTWLWLSVPLYYLAVFSKEHAIMLVAVLPLLTIVLQADWRRSLKQQSPVLVAMALVALYVVLAMKGILGSVYEPNPGGMLSPADGSMSYSLSALKQMEVFFKYAFLWVMPLTGWMSIDMREPFATFTSPLYWFSAIAFLSWGAAGLWLISRRGQIGLLGFALLFPWLMFMTELSTVRSQEVFVLYRSYLWAVGALCALPLVLRGLPARTSIAVSAVVIVILFLLSMERLVTMSHPVLLWESAKQVLEGRKDLPGTSRIFYNLGSAYSRADMPDKAIPELMRSAELAPNFSEVFSKLGAAYTEHDEWGKAVASYSQAMEINLNNGKSRGISNLLGRAQAYENAGEIPKSQADYQESCRLARRGCDKIR